MAEPAFPASTFNEMTRVYTYCGGWVNISARIKGLIRSVIVADGVTEIADVVEANGIHFGLFEDCTALTSITFPQAGTFVKIGSRAMRECTSLATLTVPDSCVNIEFGSLSECSSLTSFTFPNKCTKLNRGLLAGCSSLTTLNISDDWVEIDSWSMEDCSSLTTLAIPNACTQVPESAFYGCTALQALADRANLTIEEYCRNKWRSPRLFAFKVNLFASYNVLDRLRVNDPLLNDPFDRQDVNTVGYV